MAVISFYSILHKPLFVKQNHNDGATKKCDELTDCRRYADSEKFRCG